jgi:antitoxin component of RelBE/YafQ-DinJ toxin-antitoxin module
MSLSYVIQLNYISGDQGGRHGFECSRPNPHRCGRKGKGHRVRILLTRTANEGMLPLELVSNSQAYDSWFREKVRQALADAEPNLDDSEVEKHFAQRRAGALQKTADQSDKFELDAKGVV